MRYKETTKVVVSIEARMNSSRLPGKMLMEIGNKPIIQHLVDRLRSCKTIDDIVIATTSNSADDPLVEWANNYKVKTFRGSEDDVLERVIDANHFMQSDIIVEITGDCPFTDPDIVDVGVNTFLNNDIDYLTNCEIPSAPPGLFVQVFRFEDLKKIGNTVDDPAVREHVSLYFYENPDKYKIFHLMTSAKLNLPEGVRIYLDYPEDLKFLSSLYDVLKNRGKEFFSAQDIADVLKEKPELTEINSHLQDVPVRF